MNWYKKARYGGSDKERSIWYHGTRGRNLQKILSEGLITSPKERSWQEDPDANFMSPSRASLGGIYLTQNLMTARGSALRNKAREEEIVIVAIEAQPRTFLMDEDNIGYSIRNSLKSDKIIANEYLVAECYMAKLNNTNDEYVTQSKNNYVKFSMVDIEYKFAIPDIIKERLITLLKDNWEVVLNRQAAYIDDRTWSNAYFRNETEEMRRIHNDKYREIKDKYGEDYQKYYDEYLKSVIPPKPNTQQAEVNFSNLLNQLTRLLKNFASPQKQKDTFNLTARTEDNIGFSGANKIVCIVAENDKYEVKLIYGKMPEQLIKDWNTSVGEMHLI